MNEIPKKKREEAVEIALTEIKNMFPVFLIGDCAVLVISVIIRLNSDIDAGSVISGIMDWRVLTGLAVGNAAALLNFYHLGVKAANILRRKDPRYTRNYSRMSYILRFIGAFIVFGILITFKLINAPAAVIPLFFPKIYYYVKAVKGR
jgi:hypothetical protein